MGSRKKRKSDVSSRKLTSNESLVENSINDCSEVNEKSPQIDLSDILMKKLKIYRVSPLFNFWKNKLRLYGKKLSEELTSKRRFSSDVNYQCKFSLNEKLRLNNVCAEAVQVEVTINNSKSIYTGYFISWTDKNLKIQNGVSLPILLVEGKGHEVQKIHSSLCKIFDCDIQPVTLSCYALATFFVKLLETPRPSDSSQEFCCLEYKIPGCEVKDSITVTLLLEDTTIVLAVVIDSLREQNPGINNLDIIVQFYNKILNHIYNIHKLDLILAELHKIVFSDASITVDGQLKMATNEAAICVLRILQHFTPLEAIVNA